MIDDINLEESLLGLLKRRAAQRSFGCYSDFENAYRFSYSRPLVEDRGRLMELTGLSEDAFEVMVPADSHIDPALRWSMHRMHRDPICPLCLREDNVRRKEWRHALVSACAIHEIRLVDTCPGCNSRLKLAWGTFDRCHCGASFALSAVEAATEAEIQIAGYVAGMTAQGVGVTFDAESDPDAMRSIWFLASGFHEKRTGKSGKTEIPKTVAETIEFTAPLAGVFVKWPSAFEQHIVERWDAGEGLTASQRLGTWYRGLKGLDGMVAEVLFDKCIATLGQIAGDPYKISAAGGSSEWMSAAEAGKTLGVRSERVVEAVRKDRMVGIVREALSGHRHTVVRRKDVEHVRDLRDRFVDKKTAREILGVSRGQLDLLLAAEFLEIVPKEDTHPCVDGSIVRTSLELLVDTLKSAASDHEASPPRTIAFRDLNLRRTTDRSGLISLFGAIRNLELTPVAAQKGSRLGDILFDADEVAIFLADAGAGETMTAGDVAHVYGWKPETVSHWCSSGFLEAKKGRRGGVAAWHISHAALAEFTRTYSVVSDLAKSTDASSRTILKKLTESGVQTCGAKAVGTTTRGHLVRIADLLELI